MPASAFLPSPALDAAVVARETFAASVFESLRADSVDGPGVTRTSYMAGEQRAHDAVVELASGLGLAVSVDAAGNLAARFAGRRPDLPAWITGSHLDSVHIGGNFDGAAGVIAGLVAIAAMIDVGIQPERDIVLGPVGLTANPVSAPQWISMVDNTCMFMCVTV